MPIGCQFRIYSLPKKKKTKNGKKKKKKKGISPPHPGSMKPKRNRLKNIHSI